MSDGDSDGKEAGVGRGEARGGGKWRLAVDTGGTFTDCIGWDPEGREQRVKVLSSASLRGRLAEPVEGKRLPFAAEWRAPDNFFGGTEVWSDGRRVGVVSRDAVGAGWIELDSPPTQDLDEGCMIELRCADEAPVLAARLLTGTPSGIALPPLELRLGTTRGTNALLENKGARVALFVTEGFGDLPQIGDQKRPELFARIIRKPEAIPHRVFEIPGRVDLDGAELTALDLGGLDAAVSAARVEGCTVAAVALLHSYRHPGHEEAVVEALEASGAFRYVIGSARLQPFVHYLRRIETVLVDATLGPILESYLDAVETGLGGQSLRVMTSSGSLASRNRFRAVDSLLSGPAGGVTGAARAGRGAGLKRLIAFDMGGTSTDVSRWDGDFAYQSEQRVGRARFLARSVKIETVAAGGGSVCAVVEGRLAVGPESAGAAPGPACYGGGGPLTVTDVNLLLGRLDPSAFHLPISVEAAEAAWEGLRQALPKGESEGGGEGSESASSDDAILAGLLQLADERMAQAIRELSVRDGYDPASFGLVAFGGAGGMHACGVAEHLGLQTIVSPRNAGLLSAEGLQEATIECLEERQVLADLATWEDDLATRTWESMRVAAKEAWHAEGLEGREPEELRSVEVRLRGQEAALTLEVGECPLAEAFAEAFARIFGYAPEGRELEVVTARLRWRLAASEIAEEVFEGAADEDRVSLPASPRRRSTFFGGRRWDTPVYERDSLPVGVVVEGPALVIDPFSTFVLAPGWSLAKGSAGSLRAHKSVVAESADKMEASNDAASTQAAPEVVQREIFLQRFSGIVAEMGEQLRRTALSTNIRERLDYSCALLDADGLLLVNAPHIPVHLGALGVCVRRVLDALPLRPGDVIVTNHPGFGGSHLPDVTVISGVFVGERRVAIIANRAHHAEIGGARPGSMPPEATCLEEEGVVIPPTYLVERGISHLAEVTALLRAGRFPSRAVAENVADLQAQVAANRRGEDLLGALIAEVGESTIRRRLADVADLGEAAARRCFAALPPGRRTGRDSMDDGSVLAVSITLEGEAMVIDWDGSSGVHPENLNATPAIVRSAVLYVLRLLIDTEVPLNEGILRCVELRLPPGMLNPPFPPDPALCPAVVGGNVETSQRLVEVLLGAFGLLAQSQGTMNNVLFGDASFGYYETIGGGAGAGPDAPGASGVHVHMTNTAITDPEVLELRFPLRLERFALRRGSGGDGHWTGGDGLIRQYRFLRPTEVSLVTERRLFAPRGANGGGDGACGHQVRLLPDGRELPVSGRSAWEATPGEGLRLETPGGGGWGGVGVPDGSA